MMEFILGAVVMFVGMITGWTTYSVAHKEINVVSKDNQDDDGYFGRD